MKDTRDTLAINMTSAFKDLLKLWYVLVISAIVMLGIAYVYLKYTAKTYRVNASVVLKIDNRNQMGRGNNDLLRAFDFVVQDRSFQNELFYLRSLPLIREVVGNMNLRTSYFLQDDKIPRRFSFGMQNVYTASPIMVIPEEGANLPINLDFYVDILDETRYYISASGKNVELLDAATENNAGWVRNFELSGIYNFGALVSHENSSFRLLLNPGYSPQSHAGKNLFFRFNNFDQLARAFKAALTADGLGVESTLATLNFRTENVSLGLDFLNNVIDMYIEKSLEEANILANKTIEHIETQLVDITDDLTASERQLQNLRLNRNIMNIDDKSQSIYMQLQGLETRRDEVNRRLSHLNQMNDYFVLYKDSTRLLAPSALGLNDQLLNALIAELTTLNTEKQRIVSQDQMRNPRLATINVRIENIKDVITENLNFSLTTARNELADLNRRIGALNREFSVLPGTQRELLDIERRFKLNDAIYTSLLERRIQAQIVKASKLPDAKVIEPPMSAGVASPQNLIIYFVFVFLGLAIPAGFIIVKKLVVNSLSTREELKLITNFSTIAYIPPGNTGEKSIIDYPKSAMAESFYILRTNLGYYLHGEKNKVILITSSIPEEGKSFAAFNLAASFAFSNARTILVEFDLRKPSDVMQGFNTHSIPGLSSYLINKAGLQDIIIRTQLPNLDVIQSGNIPPNPIALLSGSKTGLLIEELRKQYDYVVIDTPPYGLLTDSFMLMTHADITLYMVRMNFTKKSVLLTNIEDLEKKNVNNLYMLVNDEESNQQSYGYGKYYLKKENKGKPVKSK